jgi:hypothetical protein
VQCNTYTMYYYAYSMYYYTHRYMHRVYALLLCIGYEYGVHAHAWYYYYVLWYMGTTMHGISTHIYSNTYNITVIAIHTIHMYMVWV